MASYVKVTRKLPTPAKKLICCLTLSGHIFRATVAAFFILGQACRCDKQADIYEEPECTRLFTA
jgi:hypothetical protein